LEIVAVLRENRLLDEPTIERLVLLWDAKKDEFDSFTVFLMDRGILNRQCTGTLSLIKRGVLARVQARQVFTVHYRKRIDELVGEQVSARREKLEIRRREIALAPRRTTESRGPIVLPGTGDSSIRGLSDRRAESRKVTALKPVTSTESTTTRSEQVTELSPPKVGDVLGKCLLTSKLASGASAVVFEALHQSLEVSVAVKVFQPHHPKRDEQMRQQFGDEARMLARLNHPNIVRILDFEERPHLFLVLEFINGYSLSDLLTGSGHLAIPQAVRVARLTAEALAFAHSEGVIHRDVKPANIMIDRSGHVKLADLGIARLEQAIDDPVAISANVLCGTPAYVAPEQAFDPGKADARSDIYSLGATIYQTITGSLPFEAENARDMILRHVSGKLISPRALRPDMPQELSDLVVRMMAKKPHDRPESMTEVVETLSAIGTKLAQADSDVLTGTGSRRSAAGGVSTIIRRSLAMLRRED